MKDFICWGLMAAGGLLFLAALIRGRRPRARLIAGLLTAGLIAGLNWLLEFFGARLGVYYVSGPWPILLSPLPLTLAWFFLAFVYSSGYSLVTRNGQKKERSLGYMVGGIVLGWLADYSFSRVGILTLGPRGTPAMIAIVWLVFIPLTIFLYEFFSALLEKGEDNK